MFNMTTYLIKKLLKKCTEGTGIFCENVHFLSELSKQDCPPLHMVEFFRIERLDIALGIYSTLALQHEEKLSITHPISKVLS